MKTIRNCTACKKFYEDSVVPTYSPDHFKQKLIQKKWQHITKVGKVLHKARIQGLNLPTNEETKKDIQDFLKGKYKF